MRVNIQDITTGDSGFMAAGKKSTFGQIVYDPAAATCAVRPYDFHPMYATSGEHTRVPWAAHTYNVDFSDEIGHFESCNSIDGEGGNCTVPGVDDANLDDDDAFCFSSLFSPLNKNLTGCIGNAVLNMDRDAVEFFSQQALIRREKIFAANLFTTGKWNTDMTGVAAGPTAVAYELIQTHVRNR